MKKDTIIAIVLGVLLVVSALQAIQLSTLKGNLQEGVSIGGGSAQVTTPAAGSGGSGGGAPSLPSSLENLPTMVGGC